MAAPDGNLAIGAGDLAQEIDAFVVVEDEDPLYPGDRLLTRNLRNFPALR